MSKNLNVFNNSVLDKSSLGVVSVQTQGTVTITGVVSSVFDKDLSSNYKVSCASGGINEATVKIDFGSVIWNATVFAKYLFGIEGGRFDISNVTELQYSVNGTDWVTLRSITSGTTYLDGFTVPCLRYVRFYHVMGVNNWQLDTTVYECRVTGS